jgi:Escherichia/Staphylococcus phage prohead protease
MSRLNMEIRSVDPAERTVTGVVVPYDEVSYLTPNPDGERVMRGAFAKSARQRGDKIFLFREHDHAHPVGRALGFEDTDGGLTGTFQIRASVLGDETLSDVREGYLPAMSVGFKALQARRGADNATEIVEARLMEVSLVAIGAYDGARVLAVRSVFNIGNSPKQIQPDLSPVMPGWAYFDR